MPEQQIKSKERVSEHGEVFTSEREVNAMLDLVKPETERIDSRFLEPACGEGAFLTEILRRKLAAVKNRYGKNAADYERYSVLAVTSIYGVDIQADNAAICRANLYEIWNEEYSAAVKAQVNDDCRKAVKYILSKKQGYIEMKVLENNKKAYKLYELLCGRYLKSFETHIVEEDNDLFKYYTFNTMDIIS